MYAQLMNKYYYYLENRLKTSKPHRVLISLIQFKRLSKVKVGLSTRKQQKFSNQPP